MPLRGLAHPQLLGITAELQEDMKSRLLNISKVSNHVVISRYTFDRCVPSGEFSKQIAIGEHSGVWLASDVT